MGEVAQPELTHTGCMSAAPHRYRIRLGTAIPARFTSWFPNLVAHRSDDANVEAIVEGPVTDSCQLAGIISAICHRNGQVLSVERLQGDCDKED